jgi:hypothetical protein
MASGKNAKRFTLVVAGLGLLFLIVFAVGFHFAQQALKDQIVQALGPESDVRSIQLSWSGVEIIGLRIRAPKGWPAADTLRAERIVVSPDLFSVFSGRYRVGSIAIEEPYVSALRAKNGRLRLLPSLIEQPARKGGDDKAPPEILIGKIKLEGGVVEFFDATVKQPALKLRLEQMHITVEDLLLPAMTGRTKLQLDGILKGVRQDGAISIGGWAELATKDSSLTTKLRGVDLVALQPYLIKASEAGVTKGALDLELKSTVHRNRLQAPGVITLSGLELSSGGGVFSTFMGVPRQAVVSFMKNQNDQIAVKFVLEGNLNDPKFSLNENIATRIALAMAESLGVSLKNIAGGTGTIGQKGLEGVGSALGRMFGK